MIIQSEGGEVVKTGVGECDRSARAADIAIGEKVSQPSSSSKSGSIGIEMKMEI